MKPVEPVATEGWRASLRLGFERNGACTRLRSRSHSGPLVVQRPLYPEGEVVCQTIVVHPPGGVAGGDALEIDIAANAGAHAQLTTPGASKWYRGFGRGAGQSVRVRVEEDGVCEWLPQENIVFDGAMARMSLDIDIAAGGSFCGWEVVCLGRLSGGAPFAKGEFRQELNVTLDGRIALCERALIRAEDQRLSAAPLLAGMPAFGTLVAAGPPLRREVLEAARAATARHERAAVTVVDGVLVVRWLGSQAQAARAAFSDVWSIVRPWYCGRSAVAPRIWAT
jgi:urease accessory protein